MEYERQVIPRNIHLLADRVLESNVRRKPVELLPEDQCSTLALEEFGEVRKLACTFCAQANEGPIARPADMIEVPSPGTQCPILQGHYRQAAALRKRSGFQT